MHIGFTRRDRSGNSLEHLADRLGLVQGGAAVPDGTGTTGIVPQPEQLEHAADRLAREHDVLPWILGRVALERVLLEQMVVRQYHRLHHRARHVLAPGLQRVPGKVRSQLDRAEAISARRTPELIV